MSVQGAADAASQPATWLNQKERGAVFGIRLMLLFATAFGRVPAGWFLRLVALWYALFDRTARRTSHEYLTRVFGRKATFWDTYRHVFCFARVTLDRVFLLTGRTRYFVVTRTGDHYLEELARNKRGALLLGAHLGSFEAMRAGAAEERLPLNIIGHFANARVINALLKRMDPEMEARVLHVGKDPVGLALQVRQCLDSGQLVGLLGDRVGLNDKHVEVDFMGGKALLPTGPYLFASALKCPIYLVFGLFSEPNRYDLYCEPFVDRVELPRHRRAQAMQEVAQRFADRLEHFAHLAPYNWFNFHDFWKKEGS